MSDGLHTAYRITRRIEEGSAGITLVLDGALPAEPGQFVMVWLPGVEERPLAVVDDAPVTLTIRRVGEFTCAMCALDAGDRIWVRGPFGHGFPLTAERPLLIGGGSGVASLALLAKRYLAQHKPVTVALGARTSDELMLDWRFRDLGCRVMLTTDDGSCGQTGTVVEATDSLMAHHGCDAVFACGPEPMLRALLARCRQYGLPYWVSLERVMRCGIGICGSCHCGDRLVCSDGPVFEASEIAHFLAEDMDRSTQE